MIEVSKAVIQKGNKYLLLKRATHSKSYPDLWDFPGGKHDTGETPTQAVIRETQEETSLAIIPGNEVKTKQYSDKKHNVIFHFFIPTLISGEITLSTDHSAYKWLSREQIQGLQLHPAVILYFE